MSTGQLTLAIVGDVRITSPDPASIFKGCASVLREAEIAFCNLEGIYSDRGVPINGKIEVGSRHVRLDPKNIKGLNAAGFDAVGLSTNHNMDWGPEALLQTIDLLDNMGIAHCGAGKNLAEARKPAVLERNGVRVAFLSCTSVYVPGFAAGEDRPGCVTVSIDTAYIPPPNIRYQPGFPPIIRTFPDPKDMEMMVEDVKKAKSQADIVIVSWHWGIYPGIIGVRDYQRVAGKAVIDAGADLVVGHHPHMLHGMELYKDKLICYSLGHFAYFDVKQRPYFGSETLILKCYIRDKKIQKITFVPCLINDQNDPIVLDPTEGRQVIKFVEDWSGDYNTAFTPEGSEVVVGPKTAGASMKKLPLGISWLYEAVSLGPKR